LNQFDCGKQKNTHIRDHRGTVGDTQTSIWKKKFNFPEKNGRPQSTGASLPVRLFFCEKKMKKNDNRPSIYCPTTGQMEADKFVQRPKHKN
jgi:hypothetical protein